MADLQTEFKPNAELSPNTSSTPLTEPFIASNEKYHRLAGNFQAVRDSVEQLGLTPSEVLIGGYRTHQWDAENPNKIVDTEVDEAEQRPVWILRCQNADGKPVIYKAQIDENPNVAQSIQKDYAFYNQVLPHLQLPDGVSIPQAHRLVTEPLSAFELDTIQGERLGPTHYEARADLTHADLDHIFNFIETFHGHSESWWKEHAPEYYAMLQSPDLDIGKNELSGHRKRFAQRKEPIKALLDSEGSSTYVDKMDEMIVNQGCEDTFTWPDGTTTVVNPDINMANILKDANGAMHFIDWEAVKLSHPILAYAYPLATLALDKSKHDYWLGKVVDKYKNDPQALEVLRYEMIYLRYSGVAVRFYEEIKENPETSPQDKAHAQEAQNSLALLAKEAIDQKGLWSLSSSKSDTNEVIEPVQ